MRFVRIAPDFHKAILGNIQYTMPTREGASTRGIHATGFALINTVAACLHSSWGGDSDG